MIKNAVGSMQNSVNYGGVSISVYGAEGQDDGVNLDAFRAWIQGLHGYVRIEDTYHSEEYRMGTPKGGIDPKMSGSNRNGRMTITFSCKPQRFLKIGEIGTEYTGDVSL